MDTDRVIANLRLEFLLRQPLEDRALNSLLSSVSLDNDNADLKKLILLKKLESEVVTRHSISESLLVFLEQLEEIEFRLGNETVSDAMKRAYCAVAVECTLNSAVNGDDGGYSSRKSSFFNTVRRIWKWRVERMEKVLEKGGLCSEELLVWKDKFVEAVWNDSVYESVVNKGSKGLTAIDAVCAFVRAEREKMGPSTLELLVAEVETVKQMLGAVKETPSHHGDVCCNSKQKGSIPPMPKFVHSRCSKESHGVEISATTTNVVGDKHQHPVPVKESHGVESNPIIVDGDGVCKESNVPRQIDIVAFLNSYEKRNVKKKRERRFWTPVEEDALRAGVKKFGEGNWKLILNSYRDKFAGRSDDDLRVKWRNMTK